MIGDTVLDAELAEPAACYVYLNLGANPAANNITSNIRIIRTGSIEGRLVCE
jgi:hypothetical protein